METLIIFLVWPAIVFLISKIYFKRQLDAPEMIVGVGAAAVCAGMFWFISTSMMTHDKEIIHGKITEKVKVVDDYQEAYECNCYTTTDSKGYQTRHCMTCYRTVYYVDWELNSTIGTFDVDRKESYSKSVWNSRDPEIWIDAYVGEHCSKWSSYENFVIAAENGLFNLKEYQEAMSAYKGIPAYPSITRLYEPRLVVGDIPELKKEQWNIFLREKMKVLGPTKQANVVIVFTKSKDPKWKLALEAKWMGGKKNDVVIIISYDGNTINWVDGFTFGRSANNHLMISQIKDGIVAINNLDNIAGIINTIAAHVKNSFKRQQMKEYEYLKDDIKPSDRVLFWLFVIQFIWTVGSMIFFIRNETFKR